MKAVKKQHRYFGPEGDTAPKPPEPPKTLTQAEVDAIVQKRLNDEKVKHNKEMAAHLERIKLLEPEAEKRAELEKRIEDIEKQGMSEKQIAEMERKKERVKLEEDRKKADEQAKTWREKFETEQLKRDLMDAAADPKADVYNPSQVVTFLRNNARLTEKLAEGKPTGVFETRVRYQMTKDGQQVEVDLTPPEVIKLMADDPAHGNMFKAKVAGGIGAGQPKVKGSTGGLLSLTQEEFNKRYAKGTLPKNTR